MAALLLGAGALAYDQIQKTRSKRRARLAHNDARFSELEKENDVRVARVQSVQRCTCREGGERVVGEGGRCTRCGGVVVGGKAEEAPAYCEVDGQVGRGVLGEGERERDYMPRGVAEGGSGVDGEEKARINEVRREGGKKKGGLGKFFRGRKGRGMDGVGSVGSDGVVR